MVSKEQVLSAQESWGSGVVSIGALMSDMVECEKFAQDEKLIKFKKDCSKMGTTEESLSNAEKIGFKTQYSVDHPFI